MKAFTVEEFRNKLQESAEGREYVEIVQTIQAENRSARKPKDGFELHHIQPRQLGGSNTEVNLIKVTYFEHCKLHVLLAKAVPCYETLRTISAMSRHQYGSCSDLEQITLEEIYEWSKLREEAKKLPYSKETRRKISEGNKGKHHSEETRKRMSELAKGKNVWSRGLVWINNGTEMKRVRQEVLEEFLQKGWIRGELKQSDELRKKKSETAKGRNTWSKGRIRIHKGDQIRVILSEEFHKFTQEGWKHGWPESVKNKLKLKNGTKF